MRSDHRVVAGLFDSHCHLTDTAFAADLSDVLARARDAGITGIVSIASNLADSRVALALAKEHEEVWCTAGVHPHEAASAARDAIDRVADLAADVRVVALGETGLDYHYHHSGRVEQRRLFDRHLELAARLELPLVVHSRDADDDTRDAIASAGPDTRGVLHCFTGGAALLDAALDGGWFVSFAGLITFRNFVGAHLLRRVPEDRVLIETDAPYLAPVPMRGRRNEPAFLVHTCAEMARLRGTDPERMAAVTTRNARAFYGLGG